MQYYNITTCYIQYTIYNNIYILLCNVTLLLCNISIITQLCQKTHTKLWIEKPILRARFLSQSTPAPPPIQPQQLAPYFTQSQMLNNTYLLKKKKIFKEQVIWFVDNLLWGKSGLCLHTKSRQISTIYLAIYKQPILLLYTVWFFLIQTYPLIQSVNTNKNI